MHVKWREFIQPPHHVLKWSLPPLPTALEKPALLCKLTSRIPLWKHGLANSSGDCLGQRTDADTSKPAIVKSLPWPPMALGSSILTETDQWDCYMWSRLWICLESWQFWRKFSRLKCESTSAMVTISILIKTGCCGCATGKTSTSQVLILLLKGW